MFCLGRLLIPVNNVGMLDDAATLFAGSSIGPAGKVWLQSVQLQPFTFAARNCKENKLQLDQIKQHGRKE